jgi:glycosyltransferase involved in cell wall biosynthesis
MSKISVIIPVWNAESYLRRCLDSVVNQTLRDIEIICVNDASTDNSLAILNEYAAKDSRMRVVSLEKNSGESVARNTGLTMAQGEYIGSVDNDDAVDLDFYEKLYARAKETGADIIKGNRLQTEYDGKVRELNINNDVRKNKVYFSWQWWTAIYKNLFIRKHNINFPPNIILNGDIVFLIKAVVCAKYVEAIDDTYYHYYRRENSTNSKILTIDKVISYLISFELIIDYINSAKQKYLDEAQYLYLYNLILSNCFMVFVRPIEFNKSEKKIKRIGAETIFRIYSKCKSRALLDVKLSAEHPSLHKFLLSNDVDGLTVFLLEKNTWGKVMATELRERLRQNAGSA